MRESEEDGDIEKEREIKREGRRARVFGGTGNLRESRPDLTSDRVRFGVRPIVGAALRERDAKEPSQRRSSCSKNKKTTTSENTEMWRRGKRGARGTERRTQRVRVERCVVLKQSEI